MGKTPGATESEAIAGPDPTTDAEQPCKANMVLSQPRHARRVSHPRADCDLSLGLRRLSSDPLACQQGPCIPLVREGPYVPLASTGPYVSDGGGAL